MARLGRAGCWNLPRRRAGKRGAAGAGGPALGEPQAPRRCGDLEAGRGYLRPATWGLSSRSSKREGCGPNADRAWSLAAPAARQAAAGQRSRHEQVMKLFYPGPPLRVRGASIKSTAVPLAFGLGAGQLGSSQPHSDSSLGHHRRRHRRHDRPRRERRARPEYGPAPDRGQEQHVASSNARNPAAPRPALRHGRHGWS
jgi:hypothetical protein